MKEIMERNRMVDLAPPSIYENIFNILVSYFFLNISIHHATTSSMSIKLIADHRERGLTRFMQADTYENACLTTADYATIWEEDGSTPVILEIFERKTLSDYTASFKDGRHANKEKLLELRAITGCIVYYIVEGPKKNADEKIGGIKYSSIEASMYNMTTNHGIHVIRTEDQEDTIRVLTDKITALTNSINLGKFSIPGCPVNSNDVELDARDLLTAKKPILTKKVVIDAMSSIKGISDKTAEALLEYISIRDILYDETSLLRDKLSQVRVSSRKLSKTVINSLIGISAEDKTDIIGNMYGMTTAKLRGWDTTDIWEVDYETFIERLPSCSYGNKTVGTKKAEKIIRWLNYMVTNQD